MSKIFNFHASFDDREKKRKKAVDNESVLKNANDSVDDEGGWIYLFPELDESDLHWAKEYDLEFKGINNHNKEKNFVMEGFKGDILEFAEDMGYMLHEDYLYEPGTFDGDVIKAHDTDHSGERIGLLDQVYEYASKGQLLVNSELETLRIENDGAVISALVKFTDDDWDFWYNFSIGSKTPGKDAIAQLKNHDDRFKAEDNNTVYAGVAADFTDPDNIPDAGYKKEIERALRISGLDQYDENGIVYAEGTYDQWVKYYELNSWMKGIIPEYENGKQFMDEMITAGAITAEGHFAEDEAYVPNYPDGVTVGDHIALIKEPFTDSELKKLASHGVKYHGYQDFGDGAPVEVIEGYDDDMDLLLVIMGRPATGRNDIFDSEDFEFGRVVPKPSVTPASRAVNRLRDNLEETLDNIIEVRTTDAHKLFDSMVIAELTELENDIKKALGNIDEI